MSTTQGLCQGSSDRVTRDELYELVWKEPMLRIAERFRVSSSYMARVCTDLRIPRPKRGYWAQLEFGKSPAGRPPLPPARPGDPVEWGPGVALVMSKPLRAMAREPLAPAPLASPRRASRAERTHELLLGAKPHFLKTRKTEAELLRPFKKVLVDIVVSEKQLDAGLAAAAELFRALEARGHRVTYGTAQGMRRAEFDEREAPNKNHYHQTVWTPDRITVVYVGKVPIGLSLFETTEEVETIYVNGTYLEVSELTQLQLRRYQGPMHWKSHMRRASGRFCLQAYCPNWMVDWRKQWRAASAKELGSLAHVVAQDLEAVAPMVASQVVDAERRAEEERQRWEEESRRQRAAEELRRQAKFRQEAKDELMAAIDAWHRAKQVQEWLGGVARAAEALPDADRERIGDRLKQARALVGSSDPLEMLMSWRSPEERQ